MCRAGCTEVYADSEAFSPSRQAAPRSRSYYPGYAYREPFTYDYKKNFSGLEYLDWNAGWQPYVNGELRDTRKSTHRS